jgi:predicted membrane-bound spermidine synthase
MRFLPLFFIGCFAALAQVLFLREMLVAFTGGELAVGLFFALWFLWITLGAMLSRGCRKSPAMLAAGIMAVMAACLPFQIIGFRVAAGGLGVAAGAWPSLLPMVLGIGLILMPTGLGIGLFFPLYCRHLVSQTPSKGVAAVGAAYVLESAGSMAGGVLLTFLLLPCLTIGRLMVLGILLLVAGMLPALLSRRLCVAGWLVVLGFGGWALREAQWTPRLETGLERLRWESAGLLARNVRLVAWRDTLYQHLAVLKSMDQFTLYAGGQPALVLPDPFEAERRVHLVMMQNPAARRVLVLGGDPYGDLRELQRYPLRRMVYVELDSGIRGLLRPLFPAQDRAVFNDSRLEAVSMDGLQYVRACRESFDVVMVNAPEPATAAANRFYTREFFQALDRCLAKGGIVHLSVPAAGQWEGVASGAAASVYRAMCDVFPRVQVAADEPLRFFAGRDDATGLTLDRETLAQRWRTAGVAAAWLRAEYFLGADELAPYRIRRVEQQLQAQPVPANTLLRPAGYFYYFKLWLRYSATGGSATGFRAALGWGGAAVVIIFGLLAFARRRRPSAEASSGRLPAALLAATGFTAMVFEIVLILVFQSVLGCVYTHIGLLMAVFMAGLVAGAAWGRHRARRGRAAAWAGIFRAELFLAIAAALTPVLAWSMIRLASLPPAGMEAAILLLLGGVGAAVGAEFPLVNALLVKKDDEAGGAAATTHAADHLGAAAGGLLTGFLLLPAFGIAGTCALLAILKCAGVVVAGRRRNIPESA